MIDEWNPERLVADEYNSGETDEIFAADCASFDYHGILNDSKAKVKYGTKI